MKKLFIMLLMLFSTSVMAAECSLYETSHPGFPLFGAHLSTGKCSTCASCHKSQVFAGTPKVCQNCHDGDPKYAAVSRSAAHIPTKNATCDSCHMTTTFSKADTHMTHTAEVTTNRCDTCHNGSYKAYGNKGALSKADKTNHITTTLDCKSCHSGTITFANVDHAAIHAGITKGCVTCHDGITVTGKKDYAAGHPTTSDNCETCHSINNGFRCTTVHDNLNMKDRLLTKINALILTLRQMIA